MDKQTRLKQVINEAIKPYLVRAIYSGYETAILKALSKEGVVLKVGGISEDLAQTASQGETRYADKVGLSWERSVGLFRAFKEAGYVAVENLI